MSKYTSFPIPSDQERLPPPKKVEYFPSDRALFFWLFLSIGMLIGFIMVNK